MNKKEEKKLENNELKEENLNEVSGGTSNADYRHIYLTSDGKPKNLSGRIVLSRGPGGIHKS